MTTEEFNKRCLEDYNSYTCKDCKHKAGSVCDEFFGLEVSDDDTCKLWEVKVDNG